jgi:hypothetical protein
MKRLNPKTNKPFKRGDVREEDGRIFYGYTNRIRINGTFVEDWRTPKSFAKVKIRQDKEYNENKEHHQKRTSNWRKNNPAKNRAKRAKERAAKLNRTPPWLTAEHLTQIDEFYIAAKMFQMYTGELYHVDHIEPLQGDNVSGLHVPWNLQVIPYKENLQKSNKTSF